jgi:hypothetical protein
MYRIKKITVIALCLVFCQHGYAQISEICDCKRNELKLDVAYLFRPALKAEYEYLLNKRSSIGVSAHYIFDIDAKYKTQLLGIYRWYFSKKKPMAGFFVEGNMGFISGNQFGVKRLSGPWGNTVGTYGAYDTYSAFGMGLALGWKGLFSKRGITIDLFLGPSKLFSQKETEQYLFREEYKNVYPRMGILIGKRF